MKVRALKDGFHGGSYRRAGSEFEVAKDEKGSWFEPVDGSKAPAAKKAEAGNGGKEQTTLSQMANKKPTTMNDVLSANGDGSTS